MDNLIRGIPMVGTKIRIMDQLLPHLIRPQFVRFMDMMAGGGSVSANVPYEKIVMNDLNTPIMGIHRNLYEYGADLSIEVMEGIIRDNQLNETNKLAYNMLRKDYNENHPDSYILLVLMYHSFNNMVRMNKKGHLNMPFGERTFNDQAKTNLREYINALRAKTIAFRALSIGLWDYSVFGEKTKDVLTYWDPPYKISGAAYNSGWKQEQDNLLMNLLDDLNDRKTSFAMSNVFENGNKRNEPLITWAKKYDVVYLENDYSNSYYTRKNAKTQEVIIKNYE